MGNGFLVSVFAQNVWFARMDYWR